MIRLTDEDDGPRVNAPIQETRALRFFSPFSPLNFSLRHAIPCLRTLRTILRMNHVSPRGFFLSFVYLASFRR